MSAPHFGAACEAAAQLHGLQALLKRCSSAGDRKRLVLTAWECGAIDRHETSLLVTANHLETA